jgi:hypothetical protein
MSAQIAEPAVEVRLLYGDQELDAILERADRAPNRIGRWMVDVLLHTPEITFTDTQLDRVLATVYRVWGKQPE